MNTTYPEYLNIPQKILFNKGSVLKLPEIIQEYGNKGLIVHGNSLINNGMLNKITNSFQSFVETPGRASLSSHLNVETYIRTKGEPTLNEITEVINKAKQIDAEWIAGIGGGSVLDVAKAAAGLYNCKNTPDFYQSGGKVEKLGIPFIAVPTTCGTGSEVTPNSVIINSKTKKKLSIRDTSFMARAVILDDSLLENLNDEPLIYSIMDSFVQAYESYTSRNANWLSKTYALKAIELIHENIKHRNKENLLLASFLGGLAFSISRLGVIHGIAHPLGVFYHEPHGLICAVCLIPSIEVNKEAMGKKYDILSDVLGKDFKEYVKDLLKLLNIKSPFKGKEIIEKEKIIKETLESGSTAASPKDIIKKDVEYILEAMF